MLLSPILERYCQKAPLALMARGLMEYALNSTELDALFHEHAEEQYEKKLLFSSIVDLMSMVTCQVAPSINAAFQSVQETLPVSLTSVYNKLNGIETCVSESLVRHTYKRLCSVIDSMQAHRPHWIAGRRVLIVDGNHLSASERRIEPLRGSIAGPLPGHSLVLMDPRYGLAADMIACEDGHAQERSLTQWLVDALAAGEVCIADRNFCTVPITSGFHAKKAFFLIRQHASFPILSRGTRKHKGKTDTGEVYEQKVTLDDGKEGTFSARLIIIKLLEPTRDGDTEMAIVTNLPAKEVGACEVAQLYRKRWTIETMFFEMTQYLEGEINALGYPRAALFGFAVALASYNVFSTMHAAMRAVHGAEKIDAEVSNYYVANEVRNMSDGLDLMSEPEEWVPFQKATPKKLAALLLRCAENLDLRKYKKHVRGPKKPVTPRTKNKGKAHVSTALELLAKKRKTTP